MNTRQSQYKSWRLIPSIAHRLWRSYQMVSTHMPTAPACTLTALDFDTEPVQWQDTVVHSITQTAGLIFFASFKLLWEMTQWYLELRLLGWALDLIFSTCPGNWPSSSPQMLSCLLYDPPAGITHTHTHTYHDWTVKITVYHPHLSSDGPFYSP